MLGRASGRHLHALAAQPRSPARAGRPPPALDRLAARPRVARAKSADTIDAAVVGLVDRVTRRMRAAGRVGRTVVLRLRFDDFSRATRSHTLDPGDRADPDDPHHGAHAADDGHADDRAARSHAHRRRRQQPRRRRARSSSSCRSIGTAAPRSTPRSTTCAARFGSTAVTRAVLLGRDPASRCRCCRIELVGRARRERLAVLAMERLGDADQWGDQHGTDHTCGGASDEYGDHCDERRDVDGLADDDRLDDPILDLHVDQVDGEDDQPLAGPGRQREHDERCTTEEPAHLRDEVRQAPPTARAVAPAGRHRPWRS